MHHLVLLASAIYIFLHAMALALANRCPQCAQDVPKTYTKEKVGSQTLVLVSLENAASASQSLTVIGWLKQHPQVTIVTILNLSEPVNDEDWTV